MIPKNEKRNINFIYDTENMEPIQSDRRPTDEKR